MPLILETVHGLICIINIMVWFVIHVLHRSSGASGSFDVLGDIMKSQTSLHRNLSDVVINPDGKTQHTLVLVNAQVWA